MKTRFWKQNSAQMGMIGAAVGLLITLSITILIFYNIAASVDAHAIDAENGNLGAEDAVNATMDQAATFFTIAPILAIVIVAVVVIGYVQHIGG